MKPGEYGAPRTLSGACAGTVASKRSVAHAPLVGLRGSPLANRFRSWQGASGRRYLFSVFPLLHGDSLDQCPRFDDAVVLAVARNVADERVIICADDTGSLPELFYSSGRLRDALAGGANEIHVHLLAEDARSRQAIVGDLQR